MARTGSGKTCAFLLPLLEKIILLMKHHQQRPKTTPNMMKSTSSSSSVKGLILSPTRELSQQTLRVLRILTKSTMDDSNSTITSIGIHGAESMEKQFEKLAAAPDIICATPGRLAHHLTEIPDFQLSNCQMVILDEADRLLEMGCGADIRQIAKSLPQDNHCQKVLLSATMPKILVEFTKTGFFCDNPHIVRLDDAKLSETMRLGFIHCRSSDKDAVLFQLLRIIAEDRRRKMSPSSSSSSTRTGLTLIFAATRHHVEYLHTLISAANIMPCTCIYGSLDQEAREANLASFRNQTNPILVVTDVAARGIDVPLIDHVIHYHVPGDPKLFIHRSGRAGRNHRVGFGWTLVAPEELPYVMELYLSILDHSQPKTSSDPYTLEDMTPDMTHFGTLPQDILFTEVENVQRILNAEASSQTAESLRSLSRVCDNAMKQYRRTRVDASREAVRMAKKLLEGGPKNQKDDDYNDVLVTAAGGIPPHPLFLTDVHIQNTHERDRQDFLREIACFRPKETVFEAFASATGKKTNSGLVSHIDRGRTTSKKNSGESSSLALLAMKDMRRQMRIVRDKGSLVVAGSSSDPGREPNDDDVDDDQNDSEEMDDDNIHDTMASSKPVIIENKRRLSKAERRRAKKNPDQKMSEALSSPQTTMDDHGASKKVVKRGAADFRDPGYYMDNDYTTTNSEDAQRARRLEAVLHPGASTTARGSAGAALRLEETMLDIIGDEKEELVQKQRLMRWDKSKRKYVQTTVGQELSGDSKSKRLRLESGQVVKGDKLKLGDLYQKWQKKTNRSIGRTGIFDVEDNNNDANAKGTERRCSIGSSRTAKRGGGGGEKSVMHMDEVKTPTVIRKERERKQQLKIKNMKKSDRRRLQQQQPNKNAKKEYSGRKGKPGKR
jgi:ATP-dependent RNA helicase DDX54/DBP10